jgi:hypothetical protein
MKPDSDTREILLLTTSSFSKRQLSETDAQEKNSTPNSAEQLEAACWNGLLEEILSGIITPSSAGNKLYLWQVEKEESCLRLSMGDCPPVFEKQFTIDPHIFLPVQEWN